MPAATASLPPRDLREARRGIGAGRLVDVAERAGCAVSLVSMAEHGYVPGPTMRTRLGEALGASAGHFFEVDRTA